MTRSRTSAKQAGATVIFTVPNTYWLSSNMRLMWAAKSRRVKYLREYAYLVGHSVQRFTEPVHITAWIGYATNSKADPVNASETGKPLIDGLVSACVFTDDSHEWVLGPDYRRDETKAPKGFHTVRFEIEVVT